MWNNQVPFNNPYYNYLNNYQQPQSSQQLNTTTNTNPVSQAAQNNIIWVHGKENARSMQLPANSTVILLDSEQDGKFYIKTTDDIGLGKLRIFSYIQEPDAQQSINEQKYSIDLSDYVKRDEMLQLIKELKDNEQSVSTVKQSDNKSIILSK